MTRRMRGHTGKKVNTMMNIITEGANGNESTGMSSSLSHERLTHSFINPYRPKGPEEGLREKPLQIMVKPANIHLTRQKPEYRGGEWHVEG